jgi:putative SOS response-associated peptidase YedK
MCGRFGASFQYHDIKVLWNVRGDLPGYMPRHNIAPSQEVPVIVRNEDRNEAKPMHWGLVPSWAPDPSMGKRMINARADAPHEPPPRSEATKAAASPACRRSARCGCWASGFRCTQLHVVSLYESLAFEPTVMPCGGAKVRSHRAPEA